MVSRAVSRYAKSILDLAIERQVLEEVKGDIDYFMQCLRSRDFLLFLRSPIIHSEKKRSIFYRIFKDKLSAMTLHFFEIIIRKGRENILPEIAEDIIRQYKVFKEITSVRLISATPIPEALIEEVKNKLRASGAIRKNIDLEVKTDPNLIGGFVLEFDDKLYDASLLYKLKQLERQYFDQSFQ